MDSYHDDDWLCDSRVTIAQVAETLDQSSLRIVPAE